MAAAVAGAGAGAALLGKGLDISLAALQQHDPYISSIVDVASQVALYTFGHRANEWVRAAAPAPHPGGERRGGAMRGRAHTALRGRGFGEAPPCLCGKGWAPPWLSCEGGGEGLPRPSRVS